MIRTYQQLIRFVTFEERYKYLQLFGAVGETSFGYNRILNQDFYKSDEWRSVRNFVIRRDDGCDLGLITLDKAYEIYGQVYVHHLNPLSREGLLHSFVDALDPNNLICCSDQTHRAIHYGDESQLPQPLIERTKNDTCPWK